MAPLGATTDPGSYCTTEGLIKAAANNLIRRTFTATWS